MTTSTRNGWAVGALTAAFAAIVVAGVATSATAATGSSNGGVRDLVLTPDSPATGFAAPGTPGTLTFNDGDGQPASSFVLVNGDQRSTTVTLSDGLAFAANACDGFVYVNENWTGACTVTNDGRTWTATTTVHVDSEPYDHDSNLDATTLPVVSTGILAGPTTAAYTPWTGLTTEAPTATLAASAIPGADTLAATGSSGPDANGDFTLTGTAQAGAAITVVDATGATVATGAADANGGWSVTIPGGTTPPLLISQTVGDTTSAPIEYNTAPLPVLNGVLAGGLLALTALASAGVLLIRRRRAAGSVA